MIRDIQSSKDMEKCVDLYLSLNDETFIPSDRKYALTCMKEYLGTGSKLKILEEDGEIVGWLLMKKLKMPQYTEPVLQQIYYASILKGFKSARAIVSLHNEMFPVAKAMGIKRVISTGSHMDEKYVFAKILERAGWDRRGYMVTKLVEP
jgi:hypothetical protein